MARTARDISKEELRTYRPWAEMERHQKDPDVANRMDRAWMVARFVAERLKSRYGATRVIVFGSLARGAGFTLWSDIDLAVWGLSPEDYYSAAGEAMDMGLEADIKVDIVDPGDCGPLFLADIEKKGVEL